MNKDIRVRKVLLIDDDADDSKHFADALHEIDRTIEFELAKDGEHGLALLEDQNYILPDFIFLDLRMPRLNGKECLARIKSSQRLAQVPVIVYTLSKELRESEQMHNLGATHFISKPSNPEEIFYILSVVLEEGWTSNTDRLKAF